MKSNGSPLPEFITIEERSYFQVNIPVHPWFLEDNDEDEKPTSPDEKTHTIPHTIEASKKQARVLNIIIENPKISIRKIAEQLELNNSTVAEHINSFKEKGVLKRVGGTRGHWEVISK